jgi:DNA-binding transcriptional ArsR family regulator
MSKNNIYNILLNPIRVRIIKVVAKKQNVTASEILENMKDVSRTTLYRHLNILIEADILTVVEEKKVRGSLERVMALNISKISENSQKADIPHETFQFLMTIYAKFENYFKKDKRDSEKNMIFLNNTVMMMDDKEFENFISDLQKLFVKYDFDSTEGRKPRDISIISSPVEKEN